MEGLLKGLIKVALGDDDGNRERDRDDRDRNEDDADADDDDNDHSEDRSRSSWAEVVSSGHEERPGRSQWGSRHEDNEGRSDGGWEIAEHKKQQQQQSRRPQEQDSQGKNDEGWETVGHKKQQQHQPSRRPEKVPVDNWHMYKQPPSEQEYVTEVHHGVHVEPTREELADLSKACEKLWELDANRLVPGRDYEIDCGEGKKVYQQGDMASESLFRWLNNDIFRWATYARFCSLLDNYNPNQGYKEVVTPQEKHEQAAFIEEISRTAPVIYLHNYLVSKGIIPEGYEEFKRMLTSLWFDLHGRGGTGSCSSAFEHVFVGEVKGRGENEVSGFHNWIQFYLEEAKGNIDYQGYIFPRRRGNCPDSETQLLTLQFEWNGVLKSVSSSFIGVSPEFEIALYTLCFFVGREDNHILLGPYAVNIKCYHLGNDKIGSVFPIAES